MAKRKNKLNAKELQNRYLNGEKLYKYEEVYLKKFLIDKADKLFGRFIRDRDKDKNCISYGATSCSNQIQNACHWISRGYYSHRRDEENVYGGCVSCNCYHQQEHGGFFENFLIKKHGIDWVDEQKRIRHKRKPTIDKLFEIIDKYKDFYY